MKKVLVTGGAGFIGSHTADLLLQNGYRVRILDNLSPKTHLTSAAKTSTGSWPRYLGSRIEKLKGDVTSQKDWHRALQGVDSVIHLAAEMDLLPDFAQFTQTNTTGTALLYETIVKENLKIKKVVVASSQFVYGEGRYQCYRHGEFAAPTRILSDLKKGHFEVYCPVCKKAANYLPAKESHQDPPNQYAITKYSQELLGIKLGGLFNIPTTALRYSIVHGPRQSFKNLYSGALRIFALCLLRDLRPPIYEDGRQRRDFVSVDDVAKANLIALTAKKADYEVFNVGGGKSYTVLELSAIIARILGKKITPELTGQFRLGDIRNAVSDIAKIKKLGWRPETNEEKTVQNYLEWLQTQKLDRDYLKLSNDGLRQRGVLQKMSS